MVKKSIFDLRTESVLNKLCSENGNVMTRKDWVNKKVSEGFKTKITQEDKIKPLSRMAFFRATNEEQRAHEKKIKAAGKKDVYWIGDYEVTKIEYDYANSIIAND